MFFWAVAMYCTLINTGAITLHEDGTSDSSQTVNKAGYGTMFYFFLTYFWGIAVFANTLHTTACGAFADWFIGGDRGVCSSLSRACTTSFGSICYGSFIIAVVQALKQLVREDGNENGREENALMCFLRCVAICILSCLEDVIQFTNRYAFVHVALRGDDYCKAASDTWQLFCATGFDMIINDDLTSIALVISALGGGVLGGFVTYFLAAAVLSIDSTTSIALGFTGGVVTFGCMMLVMSLVSSIVATIYVTYCEMPDQVYNTSPTHFATLVAAWEQAYPTHGWYDEERNGVTFRRLPYVEPTPRRRGFNQ